MEQSNEPLSDNGLREFVDAEFAIEGIEFPAKEKILREAMEKLPGLKRVSLAKGRLVLQYDAVETTREEIVQAIESSGLRVAEKETAASSPMTDAMKNQLTEKASGEETRPEHQS